MLRAIDTAQHTEAKCPSSSSLSHNCLLFPKSSPASMFHSPGASMQSSTLARASSKRTPSSFIASKSLPYLQRTLRKRAFASPCHPASSEIDLLSSSQQKQPSGRIAFCHPSSSSSSFCFSLASTPSPVTFFALSSGAEHQALAKTVCARRTDSV